VKRFWEKPARPIAQKLLADGCLWNTFVMVGTVGAFLEMIRRTSSTIFQTLGSTLADCGLDAEEERMQYIYDRLTPTDFSKQVLSVSAERLAVANCGKVGWNDLGDPRRLVTALTESGIENPWACARVCGVCGLEPEQIAMLPPSDEAHEVVLEIAALHSLPA
jgi:mannose-1-phosphate guanylyltransferase